MELNILEQAKHKLLFELKGEDHTFCNALKQELWNDSDVKVASYNIAHPLIGIPEFMIETKSKEPKKVLMAAAKRLQKELAGFRKAF